MMQLSLFAFTSLLAIASQALAAEAPTAPGVGAQWPDCSCEAPICPLELVAECKCKNEAAEQCFQSKLAQGLNCPKPTALKCEQYTDIKTEETASKPTSRPPVPNCTCEETICTAQWPESCYCQNKAKIKCYQKCGGVKPETQKCPRPQKRDYVPAPVSTPTPEPTPQKPAFACPCEPVFCIQSFPDGCICQNEAARTCFENCGGAEPQYADCTVPESQLKPRSLITTSRSTPTPPPSRPRQRQRCGSRGLAPCAAGQVCIDDPARGPNSCGMACDIPGICVEDRMCGGFAGFSCPRGMKCVDDPRDDCSAAQGGADCAGLCA